MLSGDDALTLPMLSIGAARDHQRLRERRTGADLVELVHSALSGDYARERRNSSSNSARCSARCSAETNPIPVKAAMEHRGYGPGRPSTAPFANSPTTNREELAAVLDELEGGA